LALYFGVVLYIGNGSKIMSDSGKSKEQLIEELKALRAQSEAGNDQEPSGSSSGTGITRRDVLSAWVAPVILTVPLIPRSGMAAEEGGGNRPGADFTAFPTKLDIQVEDPTPSTFEPTIQQPPTMGPTFQTPSTNTPTFQTPSTNPPTTPTMVPTMKPTSAPTSEPTSAPTSEPTSAPTSEPTSAPTSSPTMTIPVELTEFEVNG
jgi:outer membrane biosynthesis protein TonB